MTVRAALRSRITAVLLLLLFAAACNREQKAKATYDTGGDPDRGKEAIARYGCNACHVIPSVEGPQGMVGPSLQRMAARAYIAGKFPNTPQNMVRWLQNPQAMDPNNAMPNLQVTEQDSRDIAAYLSTLQ